MHVEMCVRRILRVSMCVSCIIYVRILYDSSCYIIVKVDIVPMLHKLLMVLYF